MRLAELFESPSVVGYRRWIIDRFRKPLYHYNGLDDLHSIIMTDTFLGHDYRNEPQKSNVVGKLWFISLADRRNSGYVLSASQNGFGRGAYWAIIEFTDFKEHETDNFDYWDKMGKDSDGVDHGKGWNNFMSEHEVRVYLDKPSIRGIRKKIKSVSVYIPTTQHDWGKIGSPRTKLRQIESKIGAKLQLFGNLSDMMSGYGGVKLGDWDKKFTGAITKVDKFDSGITNSERKLLIKFANDPKSVKSQATRNKINSISRKSKMSWDSDPELLDALTKIAKQYV